MPEPVKVTAFLLSPLAGEPPMLDSLLELRASKYAEAIERDDVVGRHQGYLKWRDEHFGPQIRHTGTKYCQPTRDIPPPPMGCLPIPIERDWMGEWLVARCSSPILPQSLRGLEHINKRIDTSEVGHFMGGRKMSIHHGTGATKAYCKPVPIFTVDRIVWFVLAYGGVTGRNEEGRVIKRRSAIAELRRNLKRITAIGSKRDGGYGQIARWEFEAMDEDLSFYCGSAEGPVLMRPIPLNHVKRDAIGWRPGIGACSPPYWHPERRTRLAIPC